ncbi:MAG: cytochrome c oxidase subunit II [Candidatus Latescibacterota bacterium]|nr:MAG: cytochrome c oxidase subunit II [Candidatus Latescibacterota bacterium]
MERWLPQDVSSYGHQVDGVIQLIFWIVGIWFVAALGILLFFAVRYRRSNSPRAAYAPARSLRSMSFVLIPVVLVLLFDLAIDTASTRAWDHIKVEMPPAGQTIRVIGKQYVWDFVHPGLDGELDTADDIKETNTLHVPVDTVVRFQLEAEDVIHSFFVPNLRLKQDAVPGRSITGWFEATREGTYQILCAELCGIGHTNMRGWLQVHSQQGYREWLAEQSPESGG